MDPTWPRVGTRQTISAGCAEALRLVLDREACLAIIVRDLFSKCWTRIEMLLKESFFVVSLILDTAPTTGARIGQTKKREFFLQLDQH
jgi:hypothetical protein